MKKSIFAVALILGATSTTLAQDKQYTPVSGDWAIGINANPFLNYMGNLIGGNDGNIAPTWNFLTTNQTITGKYFASDDMAYRGSLRIGFGSMSGSAMIGQDGAAAPTFPNLPTTVEDSYKMGTTDIGLSGGLEWRKGKGRLIGFYGGELGIMISSSETSFEYGNSLTTTDQTASDFSTETGITNTGAAPIWGTPGRLNEQKSGTTFGVGVRGFIGAEYFLLPKLSLGGEFGWGLVFSSTGAGSDIWSTTDGTETAEITYEGTKSSEIGVDTDANNSVFGPAGVLRMTLHF
jgi:hypothetical protein